MTGKKIKVLIFSAGEVNSVELHSALSGQVNIELFGASSTDRHGSFIFSNYVSGIPNIDHENFIFEFNQILIKNEIDLIIPTHDSIVYSLSAKRSLLEAKLLASDEFTCEICRDKKKTYDYFCGDQFIPKTFEYPLVQGTFFVKPKKGQGGVGSRKILVSNEQICEPIDWEKEIVCEFLPGEELTVDCLTDSRGLLIGVFPRTRDRVMAGVSVAGRAIRASNGIRNIAESINKKLNFLGMWYFQIKQDVKGDWKLLEISARCSGSQCLTRARGVNLPLLSVYIAMGRDVIVKENNYGVVMDRTLVNRFRLDYNFDYVYVDFDDTVIFENRINEDMMRLLYQLKNEGKKITLLTKHSEDIFKTLREMAISEYLFYDIVHLRADELKSSFIHEKKSVFIDNSFQERLEVSENIGIPVFDVDAAEILYRGMK